MIKEDRLELNARFIKVFEELERKGTIVKNDRSGKGIGDVAELLCGNKAYGHIVRRYLDADDKRVIDYRQAKEFCKAFNVNETYLVEGKGEAFSTNEMFFSSMDSKGNLGNIMYTSVQAFAGSAVDAGSFYRENNNFFSLPGVSGSGYVAFPIKGNSMDPIINNGDIIVCQEIGSFHEIKENEIYAVRSNGSVWVKYIKCIKNNLGRVVQLKLISANYLEHDPFVEEVNEYTKIFKVIKRISSL